jgi:hypothetical protein
MRVAMMISNLPRCAGCVENFRQNGCPQSVGVRTIVDDASVYDHLKLMSAFVYAAGYKGLLVGLDEMVNIFKLSSAQARNANYEQICASSTMFFRVALKTWFPAGRDTGIFDEHPPWPLQL